MKLLAVCLFALLGLCLGGKGALRGMFPDVPPMMKNGVDPGQPLFLTPYIEKGDFEGARKAAMVDPIEGVNQVSFAGFMTVNKTYNSNMFFWFWPAQSGMDDAPVVLWLQGGPGGSSLFGMFVENGPYLINAEGDFIQKAVTWNKHYSMLYIDNPVGTGFSFTQADAGYAKNEDDVARDLYSCIYQFFQMFTMIQKNEFYVTGESYAGKYVPAISNEIVEKNIFADMKINIQGMAIGDGLCDPQSMMPQYADFMFQIGMLDEKQRDFFQAQANIAVQYIQQKKFTQAFQIIARLLMNGRDSYFWKVTQQDDPYNYLNTEIFDSLILGGEDSFFYNVTQQEDHYNFLRTKIWWSLILSGKGSFFWNVTQQDDYYNFINTKIFDMLLNGDLYPYKPFFYNATQTNNYYNFLMTEAPLDFGYYAKVLADPAIRKAIHVGNLTYNDGTAVEKHIINDIMDTVKPRVENLMDKIRVMMYTGQLDIIVAIPLTEAFLQTLDWSGAAAYKNASRLVWKINPEDREVAGYVRQVGTSFYQVIVRGGGHILPYDQPARSYDMITRFISKNSFTDNRRPTVNILPQP